MRVKNIYKIFAISIITIIMLTSAISYQYERAPYITKNEEGVEWILKNIPKDNSIIFAPDYISVILKSKGYRVAIYDDTLYDKESTAIVKAELFLIEGYDDLSILERYNLTGVDVYVMWGSREEKVPLPMTKLQIPTKEYKSSKYFEKVYRGADEIEFIYKQK